MLMHDMMSTGIVHSPVVLVQYSTAILSLVLITQLQGTGSLSNIDKRAGIALRSDTVQRPFSTRPGVVRGFRLRT